MPESTYFLRELEAGDHTEAAVWDLKKGWC